MKKLAQLIPAGLIVFSLSSILSAATIEKDYSLKLSRPGEPVNLEAEVFYGSIKIKGYKGDTVEIKATFSDIDDPEFLKEEPNRWSWKSDVDIKPRASDGLKRIPNNRIHLDISERDNEVDIGTDVRNRMIGLEIMVPFKSDIQASVHAGGDVTIEGITGMLEIDNHRGGINAIDINGPVVAETWGADIVVSFQSYDTEHPSSFTTHLGNVDITLPEKSVKANLMVQSIQGEILSGLNTEFVPSDDVVKSKKGRQRITLGGAMLAKVNGGGQIMNAQTYSGNIYLRRR